MWPSYAINLAANTRRLTASAAQLKAAGLPWHRVEGVNGWQMTAEAMAEVYDAKRNARDGIHALVAPEIGFYLSHVAAWTAIVYGDTEGGFCIEDDCAADATLADKLTLLSKPQDMWDMVSSFPSIPSPRW